MCNNRIKSDLIEVEQHSPVRDLVVGNVPFGCQFELSGNNVRREDPE